MACENSLIVAVDGPSGSGKSTVCREVARRCGLHYLETGGYYRLATLIVLRTYGKLVSEEAMLEAIRRYSFSCSTDPGNPGWKLEGRDVTHDLRANNVSRNVSLLAAKPAVRKYLVEQQRTRVAGVTGVIAEGRDVGSVVFPDAAIKLYLTASAQQRALRRARQEKNIDLEATAAAVIDRDTLDSQREVSPLRQHEDAIEIDNGAQPFSQTVQEIVALIAQSGYPTTQT